MQVWRWSRPSRPEHLSRPELADRRVEEFVRWMIEDVCLPRRRGCRMPAARRACDPSLVVRHRKPAAARRGYDGRCPRCFSRPSATASSKGGHADGGQRPTCRSAMTAIANTIGFRDRFDRAHRPEAADARGDSRHRRRDRPLVAAVSQRRRCAHPAEGQSVDRGRDRAQAVSRPAAYRDHRTARLRALAEGRPRPRGRARRRRWSSRSSPRMSRICRWWSARAPISRPPNFSTVMDRYPQLQEQVHAYVLVAERRWNLRLKNGIDIRLPEAEPGRRRSKP